MNDSLDPGERADAGREEEVVDVNEGDKGDAFRLVAVVVVELFRERPMLSVTEEACMR